MRPDDIEAELDKRPFKPFRLHLSDGTSYDVRHPDLVLVGRSSMIIGVPGRDTRRYDNYNVVSLLHITRMEPVAESTPASN